MKIETMSMDLFRQLWDWWDMESLSDDLKGHDPFKYMLCETEDIPWYLVDNTVFVVYKIRPGWDAEMLTLNLPRVDRVRGLQEINNIFREYDLQRITLPLPHPVRKTARAAHRLGFKMEGRLKDATTFEGIFQDLDLFGAHRREFLEGQISQPVDKPRRRRRRRKTEEAGAVGQEVTSQETAVQVDA